jgi:hypothetical protein
MLTLTEKGNIPSVPVRPPLLSGVFRTFSRKSEK